jgi:membrane protein DedA with SNARE-associated domain
VISVDQLLTYLLLHGYPVLFGVVLVAALGLPIPANLTLLAAGGFVAQGELEALPVVGAVLAGAVLGDCAVYGAASLAGEELVHRHGARLGLGPGRLAAARARIGPWMGLSVFMSRWLITPLAVPLGVVAGLSRHPRAAYAAAVVAGESVWTALYVGLGYLFGASWPSILEWVEDSAGLVAGLTLTGVALGLLLWLLRARPGGRPAW